MAQFGVTPNAAGGEPSPPAASFNAADAVQAELNRVAAKRAAILANADRPGTVKGSAGGLVKGTAGLTTAERIALLVLDAQEEQLRAALTAAGNRPVPTVGGTTTLPQPGLLPMWKADP